MRVIRRLSQLSREERGLLLQATVVVGTVRLGLWVLPFRTLRDFVAHTSASTTVRGDVETVSRVGWAVTSAARRIPAATCLTQALAAQYLLRRRGVEARLRIGVARERGERLQAHAWVESGGRVVVGGDPRPYTVLPLLEGEPL
jgi:hypothetical protein